MRRLLLASAALVLVAVAGCSSATPTAQTVTSSALSTVTATSVVTQQATVTTTATVTASQKSSSAQSSSAQSSSAPAAPSSASVGEIGTTQPGAKAGAKLTLLDAKDDLPGEFPPDGQRVYGVLVRNCVGEVEEGAFTATTPWTLIDADDGQYELSDPVGEQISPGYPINQPVKSGDCIKGWLVARIPKSVTPTELRYTTQILPEDPVTIREWKLG